MSTEGRKRRPFLTGRREVDETIASLCESLAPDDDRRGEFARQLMTTVAKMLIEGGAVGDLKLCNSALKELRHSLYVFGGYKHVRKVAVFGSARTEPEHPDWQAAHAFSQKVVDHGWMVITGAGDGIMAAAQGGAGREAAHVG